MVASLGGDTPRAAITLVALLASGLVGGAATPPVRSQTAPPTATRPADAPLTEAYGRAQRRLMVADPDCGLSWTTLAAVGEVVSRQPAPVVGDDTDGGAYDGDPWVDRAMGPLGLTPGAWRRFAADGDGDGVVNAFDVDDAALALAGLLCSGRENLRFPPGFAVALDRHWAGEKVVWDRYASMWTTRSPR